MQQNSKADLENIHPLQGHKVGRPEKEALLKQHGKVLWLTGLSGSGKSTLAKGLEERLIASGHLTMLLDGDNLRTGLNSNLSFTEADRLENIRRVAEVSRLFLSAGVITINSFISPTLEIREMARKIIGPEDFLEVYVNSPLAVCEDRDVKGLYEKARNGEILNFTGIDAPFEEPESPAFEIRTDKFSIEESVQRLYHFLQSHISIS
ncbi:MAG: adenylyl-sulfate kinase [Bacteroidia bacterium]